MAARGRSTGLEHGPGSPEDVRSFFSVWISSANAADWETFAGLMHADIVVRDPLSPEPGHGRGEALARAKAEYEPCPDGRIEMVGEPFVALDEPEVAYRWRFVGTHLRPIDPPGFSATGRRIEIKGASVLRFRDQQVIELTLFYDTTDVARRVMAAPPRGGLLERCLALCQRLVVRLRGGSARARPDVRPTSTLPSSVPGPQPPPADVRRA